MSQQVTDDVQLRRADNGERFVAFAFAAADLVAEIDGAGLITYAAGAFRSKFGKPPEAWIGRRLHDMVAPADHGALSTAIALLEERRRMPPWTVRLANRQRTEAALAGLCLAPSGRPMRMCVTFALPPSPITDHPQVNSAQDLAQATEARMRADLPCEMGLLEIAGCDMGLIAPVLAALAPDALTSEMGPGRIGLLGSGSHGLDLMKIAASLEGVLEQQGVAATVSSRQIAVEEKGLTQRQVALALRQALDAFTRGGMRGLDSAGFQGGLTSYVQGTLKHTTAMRQAIKDRRFDLVYQPIVSLADRSLHHVEALLRPRPVPGCPADTTQDFVILAETVGLASELDLAVVGMACDAATRSSVPVAFNLSGQSMQDPAFRERLVAMLTHHPARKARKLVVEMTETSHQQDLGEANRTAQMLRELDIPFCLDDFGSGAADVRVLRALSVDIVKLDGSYVPGIVANGRERAFVSGMIEIARAAGALVVAERVETEAEAAALRAVGADYGQGWLFGRPGALPVERGVVSARRRSEATETSG